jgi:thiaminase (transcriptional activator TenA)
VYFKITTITMKTEDLWQKASSLIAVTEKHPFLVAMVEGTLNMDSFRYYVVQDALYLQDFGDCLSRLSQCDGISQTSSNRLVKFTKGVEDAEMSLHNSFFKQWDIQSDGVEQMPNTLLYTSYMKRIVVTCSHAEGLACLLPCFWVYGHVGSVMLKLREGLGDS